MALNQPGSGLLPIWSMLSSGMSITVLTPESADTAMLHARMVRNARRSVCQIALSRVFMKRR